MVLALSALVALMALPSALAAPSGRADVGAMFFMTNDPSGNEVAVSSISSNGQTTFVKGVSTGGIGATGIGGGPDALFSQHSVLVSHGHLFVVNPGSNTLSTFALDASSPTSIKQLGKPVSTSGEFPVAVARSPSQHKQVCVLNGGAVNGVACYHMNHLSGLTPMANTVRSIGLNQTTPATGPAGSVSDLLFSEDGKMLLASVKGAPPTPGFVAAWQVSSNGSLSSSYTQLTATAGGLPFGMSIIPGKNALLATDPAVGATTFSLAMSSSNSTNPTNSTNVTTAIPISGQGAVCWSAFSPKTGSFFVTDIGTAKVTEIQVNNATLSGTIVKQYQQTVGSATIDETVGTIRGNDYLYVLASNATSPQVDVLAVGNAPGQAKSIQTLDIGAGLTKSNIKFSKVNLQGMAVFVPKALQ